MHVQSREWTRPLRVLAALIRPLLMVLTRRDWRGADRFPDGGFVLAVNHLSHADPLLVAHLLNDHGIPPHFLAKQAVLDWPVVGRLVRATGQIPVRRRTVDAAQAYQAAVQAVRGGECVVIHPEGTLTRDPDLWPMTGRTGAVRVGLATGCPVVPVAQWGAQEILYPYARRVHLLRRPTITMSVGEPVPLDDLRARPLTVEVLREGTERVMDAITALLADIRGEPAPPQRYQQPGILSRLRTDDETRDDATHGDRTDEEGVGA